MCNLWQLHLKTFRRWTIDKRQSMGNLQLGLPHYNIWSKHACQAHCHSACKSLLPQRQLQLHFKLSVCVCVGVCVCDCVLPSSQRLDGLVSVSYAIIKWVASRVKRETKHVLILQFFSFSLFSSFLVHA